MQPLLCWTTFLFVCLKVSFISEWLFISHVLKWGAIAHIVLNKHILHSYNFTDWILIHNNPIKWNEMWKLWSYHKHLNPLTFYILTQIQLKGLPLLLYLLNVFILHISYGFISPQGKSKKKKKKLNLYFKDDSRILRGPAVSMPLCLTSSLWFIL